MVKMTTGKNSYIVRKQILNEIKEKLFRQEFKKMIKETYKSPQKHKRVRSAFTTEQVQFLENEFKINAYVEKERRQAIAEAIQIPERGIKIWFQNRRMKEKTRQQEEFISHLESMSSDDQRLVRNYTNANELMNLFELPSVNDRSLSLPMLNSSEESGSMIFDVNNRHETEIRKKSTLEAKRTQYYKENPVSSSTNNIQDQLIITRVPSYQTSQNRNRASSSFLSAEYSIELMKKYSREINNDVEQHKGHARDKHEYPQAGSSNQYDELMLPQDLSMSKRRSSIVVPYDDRMQVSSPSKPQSSSDSVRLYNYNQAVMRPDNLLLKPVKVPVSDISPMIAHSSKVFPISSSMEQNCRSSSCRCECHFKGCHSTPIVYEVQNPRVQYVLSALPMQGMESP